MYTVDQTVYATKQCDRVGVKMQGMEYIWVDFIQWVDKSTDLFMREREYRKNMVNAEIIFLSNTYKTEMSDTHTFNPENPIYWA